MRSAPSVRYPVGRSFFWLGLLVSTGALGLVAVLMGWHYGGSFSAGVAALAWSFWVTGSVVAWRRQPQGMLLWRPPGNSEVVDGDSPPGEGWSWSSAAYREGVALRRVERVYDFQKAVLLRLYNPDGASSWAWVERRSDPARWGDLRRAMWAHA